MFNFAHRLWRRKKIVPTRTFQVDRPLVLIQSDDWGRVGVRDREGYELLRESKIRLGEHPYDFYSLETAEDLSELHALLKRHRDSTGRSACISMNFVMANLDFDKMAADDYRRIQILPLTDGLPGKWKRKGLFEAYREGISDGIFYPCLHGLTHFCGIALKNAQKHDARRTQLLNTLWRAETPYIYWRMPWVGYEYLNPERPQLGFLSASTQGALINEAAKIFEKLFSRKAKSACAPGYRANEDTHRAWAEQGIRVAQNGSGAPQRPHLDDFGMLHLHRTIDFEPGQKDLPLEKYMQLAEGCFTRGVPAIISVHSINFHSTLKDFRTTTLSALHEFLAALERRFPNLLYLHDMDVYNVIDRGKFRSSRGMVSVGVRRREEE